MLNHGNELIIFTVKVCIINIRLPIQFLLHKLSNTYHIIDIFTVVFMKKKKQYYFTY